MKISITELFGHHPYLKDVISCIKEAGGVPFLVGGSVRDMHLGIAPKDLDIEVFGLSQKKLGNILSGRFRVEYVGQSFGVFIIKGYPIDIAIPRTEVKTGPKHTDFDVVCDPFLSIEQAASRRDFTINAIYLNLLDDSLVDPYGGIADIYNRILRHTSDKFVEDALRVYRAMQFIARFDLECANETLELCKSIKGEHLPHERIFAEFEKLMLHGRSISKGLDFLRACGWVSYFPELEAIIGCEQDPVWHPEGDVWNHTLLALNAFANRRTGDDSEDLLVGLAVLCHDLGKPKTTIEEGGRIRSPKHDIVGVNVSLQFLTRLTRNREILEKVPLLVREHMIPSSLQKANAGNAALRRLALRVGRVDRLLRVCQADREGRIDPWIPQPFPEGEWLAQRMENLQLKDQKPKPILQGRDLIAIGLQPGIQFGEILERMFQAQLDGEFSTHEDGIVYLKTRLKKN